MSKWLKTLKKCNNPILHLICFHNAGGGASIFNDWWQQLPNQIEIIGIQLPGRENRYSEQIPESIEIIVQMIAGEFEKFENTEMAFFGHSMGGLIAYELARNLQSNSKNIPRHLFISGRASPNYPRKRPFIHNLPKKEFIEEIIKYDGIPKEILSDADLQTFFLPTLIKDIKNCELYRFQENNSKIDIPINLYNGDADLGIGLKELEGWKRITTKKCSIKMFAGGHFYFRDNPEFFNQLNTDLSKIISIIRLEESSKAFIGKPTN